MPARLTRPTVGLIPTSPLAPDGQTIDPSVSVPTPTAARLAATAAPVPELDPHGLRSSAYGIPHLAAAPAPAAGGMTRAEVGPLAQVGLAEDDRAGRAQSRHHERVLRRHRSLERQRPGGGHHAIAGVDVVLDDDRDTVQRTARTARPSFVVQRVGDGQRVRVDLDDRSQRRSLPIDLLDPAQIELGDLPGGVSARRHPLGELRGSGFLERKRGRRGGLENQREQADECGARQHGAANLPALEEVRAGQADRRSTMSRQVRAAAV